MYLRESVSMLPTFLASLTLVKFFLANFLAYHDITFALEMYLLESVSNCPKTGPFDVYFKPY